MNKAQLGANRAAAPIKALALGALVAVVTACAAGSQESLQAAQGGNISEIVLGFWHGIIAPFTLLGEIIVAVSPNALPWPTHFYEARHVGVLYDVGFYIGLIAGPSMLWTGASRRRRITVTQP